MKLSNIFIPAISLTALIVGICKHYYNLDMLSMDSVCIISITSFVALVALFLAISIIAITAAENVMKRQIKYFDESIKYLAKYIDESFKASDGLTKDIVTQQSVKIVETIKEIDVKHLSINPRDKLKEFIDLFKNQCVDTEARLNVIDKRCDTTSHTVYRIYDLQKEFMNALYKDVKSELMKE